jgi:hypothetical protein
MAIILIIPRRGGIKVDIKPVYAYCVTIRIISDVLLQKATVFLLTKQK